MVMVVLDTAEKAGGEYQFSRREVTAQILACIKRWVISFQCSGFVPGDALYVSRITKRRMYYTVRGHK